MFVCILSALILAYIPTQQQNKQQQPGEKKHLEITQTKMKTNPNIMMIIRSLFTYSLFGAKKKKKKKVTGVFVCLS